MFPAITAIAFYLACATGVIAQGYIAFEARLSGDQETPPTSSSLIGSGAFYLSSEGFLVGNVETPWAGRNPWTASVQTRDYQVIMAFQEPRLVINAEGGIGAIDHRLEVILTASQRAQLLNNEWWVNIPSQQYPNGEIRGQIIQVPEPSVAWLIATASVLLWLWKRR